MNKTATVIETCPTCGLEYRTTAYAQLAHELLGEKPLCPTCREKEQPS